MSKAKYTRNKMVLYFIEYSYLSLGERKEGMRPTYAQSKKEALAIAEECLIISNRPGYTAKVIGTRQY